MMMIVEQSVECKLAGETKVLGENLPQLDFIHHKFHMTWPDPGTNTDNRGEKPETNCLSYGTALLNFLFYLTVLCTLAGHGSRAVACFLFVRSEAVTVGSNPTQGMDV
jgi:hypothetical protein